MEDSWSVLHVFLGVHNRDMEVLLQNVGNESAHGLITRKSQAGVSMPELNIGLLDKLLVPIELLDLAPSNLSRPSCAQELTGV